jgi:hypothetical protein
MDMNWAMFESLTITTILFILFFFWQNKRLGLTSEIPLDPKDRVHFFASECLTTLKNLLPHCSVREIGTSQLIFVPSGQQQASKIYVQDGRLCVDEKQLNELGSQGQVHFEKASDTGLMVTVEAKTDGADHKLSLRLEVTYA